jgi:hypothetical protein
MLYVRGTCGDLTLCSSGMGLVIVTCYDQVTDYDLLVLVVVIVVMIMVNIGYGYC